MCDALHIVSQLHIDIILYITKGESKIFCHANNLQFALQQNLLLFQQFN